MLPFEENKASKKLPPLAHRARPIELTDFRGKENLFKRYPFLEKKGLPHGGLIFYGPPGTGKTTFAKLLAKRENRGLVNFNAVLSGVTELRKLIARALDVEKTLGLSPLLFIDEIHRFNRAQQDALLPHVEEGTLFLIGATTENPRVSINEALLSRVQTVAFRPLNENDLLDLVLDANEKYFSFTLRSSIFKWISQNAGGDARRALNFLELAQDHGFLNYQKALGPKADENRQRPPLKTEKREVLPIDLEELKPPLLEMARHYDKNRNRHYDVISAFIKSMRGSDPDAALMWLAVMLDGGEDPIFVARRMLIFASEDVGNADPRALTLMASILTACEKVGMPEARIPLAQGVTYLASTVKSNASYLAIGRALKKVKEQKTIEVPFSLRNFPPPYAKPYLYPHNYENHFVKQDYGLAKFGWGKEDDFPFYRPTENGQEKFLKERLEHLKNF